MKRPLSAAFMHMRIIYWIINLLTYCIFVFCIWYLVFDISYLVFCFVCVCLWRDNKPNRQTLYSILTRALWLTDARSYVRCEWVTVTVPVTVPVTVTVTVTVDYAAWLLALSCLRGKQREYPWARWSVTFRYEYETEQRNWQKLARVPKCPLRSVDTNTRTDTHTQRRTPRERALTVTGIFFGRRSRLRPRPRPRRRSRRSHRSHRPRRRERRESTSRFHSIPNESKIGIRSQLRPPTASGCGPVLVLPSVCSAFEFVLV